MPWSSIAPTVGFLGAERVLQRLRCVRGQDDATETGRKATPQRIVESLNILIEKKEINMNFLSLLIFLYLIKV